MSERIMEQALRQKLRFNHKGLISAEDLYDLSEATLNSIYKSLTAQAQLKEGKSLIAEKSGEEKVLELKIAVVEHVYNILHAEKLARLEAAHTLAMNKKIKGIIAQKKDEKLLNMPIEELERLIN